MSKQKKVWLVVVVVVLIIVGASYWGGDKDVANEVVRVVRGDVIEDVAVTGRVTSSSVVSLGFERGGKVSGIYVDVGSKVVRGALLATISSADLSATLERTKASLNIEEATLLALRNGSSINDTETARVKYENSRLTESNKQTLLQNAISVAYVKTDSAINYYIDQFFSNPHSLTPQFNITSRADLKTGIESDRLMLEATLVDLRRISTMSGDKLEENVASAISSLISMRLFISSVALAINELSPSAGLSSAVVAGYKNDVSTSRTIVETEIANMTSAYQAWTSASADSALLEQQYNSAMAPARVEDIVGAEARVARAVADVSVAQADLAKTRIYAPFSGLVTKQDYRVGETVTAYDAKIAIIDSGGFDIEANIPEADIAHLAISQEANVTLDAYGSNVNFPARVISIEPAERVIDGVATYKTILHFVSPDARVKSGMTANITIITNVSKGTLSLPSRMVTTDNTGKTYVWVEADNAPAVKTEVRVGLRGSDGSVEILGGLSEGQAVIVAPDETN